MKGMATPSILALEIPWTEEPGQLQSMGLERVGHNLATEQQFLLLGFIMDSIFSKKWELREKGACRYMKSEVTRGYLK